MKQFFTSFNKLNQARQPGAIRPTVKPITGPSGQVADQPYGTRAKVQRFWDVLLAVLGIIFILSWLMPVIGLLIGLTTRGPVLYIQIRVGRRGRPFTCIKLRTRVYNSRPTFFLIQQSEERFTWMGAFLERTQLDKLPQLINVLMGDMSLGASQLHPIHHSGRNWSSWVDRLGGSPN